ncbi:MAG: bifunctional folylpolyglutamate synthase/dihydrofolate synthase, partial [Pseudomonas sp.]
LAAFWLFQRAGLDAAVLEVGLGGRLDAVNLIDADLALVTSIGLDHAEWLGDTRESVAFEKAGIFRAGKPALCGDLEPPLPLLEQAAALDSPFFLRGRDYDLATDEQRWHWRGLNAAGEVLELHGLPLLDLPLENAALALQAYALLDLPWQPERIAAALARTRVSGRLDRRTLNWQGKSLTLLLDVGHNPHAAEYLARRLASRPLNGRRLAVFGLLADKDLTGVLAALGNEVQHWAVAPLPTARTRPAAELEAALLNRGACVTAYADVATALEGQCAQATADDEILLFGSFYCVAEALGWLAQVKGEAGNGIAG